MSHQLIFRREFEFETQQPKEIPLWLTAHRLVIDIRGLSATAFDAVRLIQYQFIHGLGWVYIKNCLLSFGYNQIELDNSAPYKLLVMPARKLQSFELSLWLDRAESMSEWNKLTSVEVGSSWVHTAPVLGSWFKFDIHPATDISIEVAQSDGENIIGEVTTIETSSQTIYLPVPADILGANERRLAFRTSESVQVQLGWKISVSVPSAALPQPIEQQILALLQNLPGGESDNSAVLSAIETLLTGQQAIATKLEEPIEAQIDPALAINVQALVDGQQQILDQFPVTVESDPALVNALAILQARQEQIYALLQAPVFLSYFAPGDRGGVFWFLGSSRLQQLWINPLTLGLIAIQVSSLAAGSLSTLTDRQVNAFWYTNSALSQWVSFDFKNYRIIPNYYTIQHTGETGYFLRSWKLQGSDDHAVWTDLDARANDTSINAVNSWGVFPISNVSTAYRYLRILTTGPDSSGSNYLLMGEIEFYGKLSAV